MSVVGFDFGNEASVIAVARHRVINVLQNLAGNRKTASMVAFSGKERLIGDPATLQYMQNYKNTIQYMKRFIGRSYDDPELKEELKYIPNKLVRMPNGGIGFEVMYDDEMRVLSAEQLTAAMFQQLKATAEMGLDGQRVTDCVIGCPSWWSDQQRRALMDAARVVGLNVLRLMNETTAVALNYGILRPLPEKEARKVMFVDVGHTSTNVCLASFVQGSVEILAIASDRNMGARNFDRLLLESFAADIKAKYKLDVLAEVKPTLKLMKECQKVKKTLSANIKVPYTVEYIMNDVDVNGVIDRPQFEELAKPLLDRMLVPMQSVLDQVGVKKEELFAIEVVGGGSRIPAVTKAMNAWFGREVSKTCDGDDSIGRGCALMCAMLSPNFVVKEFQVKDITPYNIELAWGPVAQKTGAPAEVEDRSLIFKEKNLIPNVKLVSFKDRTDAFQVTALYQEPAKVPHCLNPVIGTFVVSGMPRVPPPNAEAPAKIKVKVKLDLNGVVTVNSAQLLQDVAVEEPAAGTAGATPASSPPPAQSPATPMEEDDTAQPDGKEATAAESADPTAAAPGATSMDVEQPTPAAADAAKRKITTQKSNLTVSTASVGGLSEADFRSAYELEAKMAAQDRAIAETLARRNELEGYVLEMRNSINGALAPYIKDADRDKFARDLEETESWLYGDGSEAQKSEYVQRLEALQKYGAPMKSRQWETQHREEYVVALKSAIGHFQQFAGTTDEKFAHIAPGDREKIVKECSAVDQWLAEQLTRQDHTPKSENPVLTSADLETKKKQLETFANGIMNAPKPKPAAAPKKEEPAKDKAKEDVNMADANAAPAAAGGDDVPMEDAAKASASEPAKDMDVDN